MIAKTKELLFNLNINSDKLNQMAKFNSKIAPNNVNNASLNNFKNP